MTKKTTTNKAFETEFAKAIEMAGGSQELLGQVCERRQQTVSLWYEEKSIPKKPAQKIVAKFPKLSLFKLMNL